MPKIIRGDGAGRDDCRLMFIGERPGREEYKAGLPFVGPAGIELWSRCEQLGVPFERHEIYVTNIVKTFSTQPPTAAEISRDAPLLYAELIRVKPRLIVTVGYHAARHLLPQFAGVKGDFFHGLAYPFTYGRLQPTQAIIIPVVHSSAALRQPDLYQNQLSDDLRAVRKALRLLESDQEVPLHVTRQPDPYRVGLAQFGRDALTLGCDTEGFLHRATGIECVAIARDDRNACVIETEPGVPPTKFLRPAIRNVRALVMHHAKHDIHALQAVGISPRWPTVHDTMLQAYLLGLPQSLKVLAYRLLGFEMAEYEDLVQPIDDARVRATLERFYHAAQVHTEKQVQRAKREKAQAHDLHHRRRAGAADSRRRADGRHSAAEGVQRARHGTRGQRETTAQGETRPVGQQDTARVQGRQRDAQREAITDARQGEGARDVHGRREGREAEARREAQLAQGRREVGRRASGTQARHATLTQQEEDRSVRHGDQRRLADIVIPLDLPKRALTSIHGILTKVVASGTTMRDRWQGSKFAPLVPLPPEPTWRDAPQAERTRYVLTDAVAAVEAHHKMYRRMQRRDLLRAYSIDLGVLPFLVRNEQIGLACDGKALRQLSKEFSHDFDVLCERINRRAGRVVNPLSGEQVAECLFSELGITPTRTTKSGKHFTTADKYLKARKLEHKIIPDILDARQINKYRGTYTDKLPALLRDGRYHPSWKYTRTATGRLAEEVILLIPKHSKRAKAIRNAFHATAGHELVSVDLSQIEMRVMADESQDRTLLEAYRKGIDVHAATARDLLGAPKKKEDQDESLHRLPAKTVNFGIINGMTEYGMLDQLHENGQLHWTIDDVRELKKEWFILRKGVRQYWDRQIAFCKRKGYVHDRFGRRRYISAIWSTDDRIVAQAERQTLMPIQAGADGISKIWNRRIWDRIILAQQSRGRYCEPWIRVHDDTTLECDARIAPMVKQRMLDLVPNLLCLPTTAEGKSGVQWGDLH